MELKKGDKVKYLGNMPYILGNGQTVKKEGEEILIISNVSVQSNFFEKIKAEPKKVEKVEKPKEVKNEEKPKAKTNKKK